MVIFDKFQNYSPKNPIAPEPFRTPAKPRIAMNEKEQANAKGKTDASAPNGNGRQETDDSILDLSSEMVAEPPREEGEDETILDADTVDIVESASSGEGSPAGGDRIVSRFDQKTIFAPGGDLDALELSDEDIVEAADDAAVMRDAKTVVIPRVEQENFHDLVEEESIPRDRFIDSEDESDEAPLLASDPEAPPVERDPEDISEFDIPFLDRDNVTLVDPIDDSDGLDADADKTENDAIQPNQQKIEENEETLFGQDASTVIAPISEGPEDEEDAPDEDVLDLDAAMAIETAAPEPPPSAEARPDGQDDDASILDLDGHTLYAPGNAEAEEESVGPTDFEAPEEDPDGDDDESIIDLGAAAVVPEEPEASPAFGKTEEDDEVDLNARTILSEPSFIDFPSPETDVDDDDDVEDDILELEPIPEQDWSADAGEEASLADAPEDESSEELFQAEDPVPSFSVPSEDAADALAEDTFSADDELAAMDLLDGFGNGEGGDDDLTDAIGLIDVLGAAGVGADEAGSDFLSRLENGFQTDDAPAEETEDFPEPVPEEPEPDASPADENAVIAEPADDAPDIPFEEGWEDAEEEGPSQSFEASSVAPEPDADDSEPESGEIASISGPQLEAALERVIDRIFTERIEKILREVIEKTVSEEVAKLRGALLENIAVNEDL